MSRLGDIRIFYSLMDELAKWLGGPRHLANCCGRDGWPERGVYFFFEEGENRTDSGEGLRVVRIGTHCVSEGSRTKLWTRLAQHRGKLDGGGNHRGSVFRLLVGDAISRRCPDLRIQSWLDGDVSRSSCKHFEHPLECRVSDYIGNMPFLWIAVDDAASKNSRRSYIERNAIALVSNYAKPAKIDAPSDSWLGSHSSSDDVKASGLWNSRHVGEAYDPGFLNEFERYILKTPCPNGCESARNGHSDGDL